MPVEIEVVTTGQQIRSQTVIRSEIQRIIADRQSDVRSIRTVKNDFCVVQLSNTEDQRWVSLTLLVVDEIGEAIDRREAEQSPSIAQTSRTVQQGNVIEAMNDQITEF